MLTQSSSFCGGTLHRDTSSNSMLIDDISVSPNTSFVNPSPQSAPSYQSIPKIRVIVRKRPLNQKELSKKDSDIITVNSKSTLTVKELKTKVDLTKYIEEHAFTFDLVYNDDTQNETIYLETVRPMIEAAFNKTKVTCFAYGQTGSGKTFTMMGKATSPGLYLLAAYDIFTLLQKQEYANLSIWVSFYEIYCGKLFDLLNGRNQLTAREDAKQNICIVGLTEKQMTNMSMLMNVIEKGLRMRTVGITGANADSSRSHGIIQICIKNSSNKIHGKISFIDLAGSERAADTIDTNKQTRIDGAEINKSLLALKECIRALDQDKKHTPFRGSKLTLVLRDSFIGNCKTLMIANISPALSCSEHTLNTLRYADRVKELRGKGDVNIGSGNLNLNYDPFKKVGNEMMMPRLHNTTVKYNVDKSGVTNSQIKKKKSINPVRNKSPMLSLNSSFCNYSTNEAPNISNTIVNINAIAGNYFNKENSFQSSIGSQSRLYSMWNGNKIPNTTSRDSINFLNGYSTFDQFQTVNNENMKNIRDKHAKLLEKILEEQNNFVKGHKMHIDGMVQMIRTEMGLLSTFEEKKNIDTYFSSLVELYENQLSRISALKERATQVKQMLLEEAELSKSINMNTFN